jgi:S-adenosylmethionine:tRNA ribosyltransferase-isomerase
MSTWTDDYDYDLPPERIAQEAVEPRDASRLLYLPPTTGVVEHRRFREIVELVHPGDLLVVNDTRVLPARLYGVRSQTGGRVECLLVRDRGQGVWDALVRAGGRPRPGETLALGGGRIRARLEAKGPDGAWRVFLEADGDLRAVLAEVGVMPLPPYIRRQDVPEEVHVRDRERYQTVFAASEGAVAAPTAGLHFTTALLETLRAQGVRVVRVTLHVGPGTFRPVTATDLAGHRMHAEQYAMAEETRDAILRTREKGGRVVCCGTTSVRTLETVARTGVLEGDTDLFIHPPFEFRWTDAVLTNFHLPRSTLLMLVAAFAGRARVLAAYREAVAEGYRFYSYGDAMFLARR